MGLNALDAGFCQASAITITDVTSVSDFGAIEIYTSPYSVPDITSINSRIIRVMGVFEGKFPQWAYLIAYNTISALLWIFIFGRTVALALSDGLSQVYLYPSVRAAVLLTQSLAALDVLHSIIGTLTQSPAVPCCAARILTDVPKVLSMPPYSPALFKSLVEAQSSGSSSRITSPPLSVHFMV